MALIDDAPRSASVYAREDSHLIAVGKGAFQDLLATSPTAALNTLHTFAQRLRETQAALHQSEKMAAIGTLTAGLAHELNNPAAAAHRAAEHLGDSLQALQHATSDLDSLTLNETQRQSLDRLRQELEARADSPVYLDTLTRSDLEAALEAWLEGRGVEAAWELAPSLVNAGYDEPRATQLADDFDPAHLRSLLTWISATYTTLSLLREIRDSAGRLSDIVRAMRQYTYLDQAPIQEVDVHEGIDNTLIILGHKLRDGITVSRQYAPALPPVTAYASELTQVWTNLIDNAVDAMNGQGTLVIRTREEDEYVVVEISDDGPGIPDDIQPRLFEPFFTTKAPGEGSGLGLHVSHNIVANKHNGQLRVSSRPGETTFEVWLPIEGHLKG